MMMITDDGVSICLRSHLQHIFILTQSPPRKNTNGIIEIPFCLRLKPPSYMTYLLIRLGATSKVLLFNTSFPLQCCLLTIKGLADDQTLAKEKQTLPKSKYSYFYRKTNCSVKIRGGLTQIYKLKGLPRRMQPCKSLRCGLFKQMVTQSQ